MNRVDQQQHTMEMVSKLRAILKDKQKLKRTERKTIAKAVQLYDYLTDYDSIQLLSETLKEMEKKWK